MKHRKEMKAMKRSENRLTSGLFADNTVLSACMVISPVIMCGDTIKNAIALIYVFTAITLPSVLIASFVPKRLPYAVKIIIYAVISSLIYIPVKIIAENYYPESIARIGIYFPLIAVNSLIVYQTEAKFFRMKRTKMIGSLIFYVFGFDAVMLITGFIRELFAYGTINSRMVDMNTVISGLGKPFGGFIFLGLMCGIYRKIRSTIPEKKVRSDVNVSD